MVMKIKTEPMEDRISQLPDSLICDILCHLCTKDAVRASVLSRRWRNLWQLVPQLDLNSRAFSDVDSFVSFTERFLDFHKDSSRISKLRFSINNSPDGKSFLTSWTNAVTTPRIQHLDVSFENTYLRDRVVQIPLSMYTCETLVHLRLSRAILAKVEFVSLPCLKIMHFELNIYPDKTTLQKFISGSPVLEDLKIIRSYSDKYKASVLQVRSDRLKRIHTDRRTHVVIDAPLLECLRDMNKIINLGFPEKLDIDIFSTRARMYTGSTILDILTDILRGRDGAIRFGCYIWKKIELFKPTSSLYLRNLSYLNATFFVSDLELLPTVLESCPKLESLILEVAKNSFLIDELIIEQKVVFSTVPRCLASSLKFVEFTRSIRRYEREMELLGYFLKNSTILEKLIWIDTYHNKKPTYKILKELLALPRCSSACEVLVKSFFTNR